MSRVSVIVPNYNHARFLRRRIDTILNQTFQDFELILLDDASTDDSRAILSSYASDPRVAHVVFNEKNSGSPFKQWNKGVRLACGEYIWIAESDDYADPRTLETLAVQLDAQPNAVYAYCRSWRVSADNELAGYADYYLDHIDPRRWTADYRANGREECLNYFIRANPVPNSSAVLFRKVAYDQVGGADESMRLCGDWKLWAAMALTGEVVYLAEPLNYFRFHESSMRSKTHSTRDDIAEMLHVAGWILREAKPPRSLLEKMFKRQSRYWVPALMSMRVPRNLKQNILRTVCETDPHPVRHAIRPALSTLRLKFLRHWRELISHGGPSPNP